MLSRASRPGEIRPLRLGVATGCRLQRDVIAYRPTVVTIMPCMNVGRYRAFDQEVFNTYAAGMASIV